MTLVLDAGAFVSIERGDRELVAILKRELLEGRTPLTHGGVVGQVWRGGVGRQVPVARVLPGVQIVPLDEHLGRKAGVLLGRAGQSDVVDAALILLAEDNDEVLTSDPDDLVGLAEAAGLHVDLISV